MTVNLSGCRMGESRVDRDFLPQGLEHIKHFGKLKIPFVTSGKPTPILPSWIFFDWKTDPIGMINTKKAFGSRVRI
jgi:hypothetical protein